MHIPSHNELLDSLLMLVGSMCENGRHRRVQAFTTEESLKSNHTVACSRFEPNRGTTCDSRDDMMMIDRSCERDNRHEMAT